MGLVVSVKLEARDKDGRLEGVPLTFKGTVTKEFDDLVTAQGAAFLISNVLDTAQSIQDTSNTARAIGANTATGTIQIVAGTGTTAAAVTDYNLQAQSSGTSGYVAASVGNPTESGTSGSFTVTGTITNSSGASITYSEVGVEAHFRLTSRSETGISSRKLS